MKIDTIILDVGGVLVQTVDTSKRRVWEGSLGLAPGQLTEELWKIQPAKEATLGLVTADKIWENIAKKYSLNISDLAKLKIDFFAGEKLNQAFCTYVNSIHKKFKIAILSNGWDDVRDVYVNKYNLDKITDKIIISAEEGLRKPDPGFFELALGKLGAIADQTLFIDDTLENIESAKELEIHTILFTDTENVIREMNKLLGIN